MEGEIERENWQRYLDEFSKRNAGRATRLEVISESMGTQPEAERLPLEGITFESKGPSESNIEIMLGNTGAADVRHLSHTIINVQRILSKEGTDGREDALEIDGGDGARTIIVFETLAALPANQSS